MSQENIILIIVLAIFNIATIRLLTFFLSGISFKSALTEKSLINEQALTESERNGVTSYSRVSGLIGAVILATFFWGLGNIILYKAIISPSEITTLLSSVGSFFLAGSSLFVPYAFNQLKGVFQP